MARRAQLLAAALRGLGGEGGGGGGGEGRYVAVHLRRRGYAGFCAGAGLRHYGGRRFGVQVSSAMCMPAAEAVAREAAVMAARARTDVVFVAS